MKTREKIDRAADTTQLCLHKEGIFYKLYNQHAMLFTENIKPLKIKVKFIKAVGEQVYSCGFPATIIEEIKKRLVALGGVPDESEKLLTVAGINWPEETQYSRWCEEQAKEVLPVQKQGGRKLTDMEKKIAGFQVMHKTPMEAMNFIVGLQKELHNDNDRKQ